MHFTPGKKSYSQELAEAVEREKDRRAQEARRAEKRTASEPTRKSGTVQRPKPCIECGRPTKPRQRRRGLCTACYFRAYRAEQRAAAEPPDTLN